MTSLQLKRKGYDEKARRVRRSQTRHMEALRWEAEMKEQQMMTNFNNKLFFQKARTPEIQFNEKEIDFLKELIQTNSQHR